MVENRLVWWLWLCYLAGNFVLLVTGSVAALASLLPLALAGLILCLTNELWDAGMTGWGVWEARQSLEEIRNDLEKMVHWSYGGVWGCRAFFALFWLTVVVLMFIGVLFGSSFAVFAALGERLPITGEGMLVKWPMGALLILWAGYAAWLYSPIGRSRMAQNSMGKSVPSGNIALKTVNLVRHKEEAIAFLSLFQKGCPLCAIKGFPWSSVAIGGITLSMHIFLWTQKMRVVPLGNRILVGGVAAGLIFWAVWHLSAWLYIETRAAIFPRKVGLCQYPPLLRIVAQARKF